MKFIANPKIIVVLFLIAAIGTSTHGLLLDSILNKEGDIKDSHVNNYRIFKHSFYHLLDSKDLYQSYPDEHNDLYKYSPTFAFTFGILAILPDVLGLTLWNILNALLLFIGIYYMPGISNKNKGWISLIVLLELIGSMQNEQSNALLAGLIILAFGLMERKKLFFATLCIVLSIYIKIFGIVAFALFLFYPHKLKFILYSAFWLMILFVLPLPFVGLKYLIASYNSWYYLLVTDHSVSYGVSVMGWLSSWFNFEINKLIIVIMGMIIFCIPLLRIKMYKTYIFRILMLSSILIWIIIFNHKAEPPSYIIAMSGIALWYVSMKKDVINSILLIMAFIMISILTTDIIPHDIRKQIVYQYVLKAFPAILIWFKIIYDMLVLKDEGELIEH